MLYTGLQSALRISPLPGLPNWVSGVVLGAGTKVLLGGQRPKWAWRSARPVLGVVPLEQSVRWQHSAGLWLVLPSSLWCTDSRVASSGSPRSEQLAGKTQIISNNDNDDMKKMKLIRMLDETYSTTPKT